MDYIPRIWTLGGDPLIVEEHPAISVDPEVITFVGCSVVFAIDC